LLGATLGCSTHLYSV